jgi:hypothetical protein
MIGLLWFVVAVLASPFKSKIRLEAENATLRHQLVVLRRDLRSESRRGFALADRANQVRNLGLNDASHIISIFHKRVNTRRGRASTP